MNALVTQPIVRRGALAVAALIALALLLGFHSVVVGAVERAAQRRAGAELAALQTQAARHTAALAPIATRRISLARAGD
jgi:hypothetical protein